MLRWLVACFMLDLSVDELTIDHRRLAYDLNMQDATIRLKHI